MYIRKAEISDLNEIMEIYATARGFMREQNNPTQWKDEYPPLSLVTSDINDGSLYVVCDGCEICAVFFFRMGEDDTYKVIYDGEWKSDAPYAVIHRVAVRKSGQGIAAMIFDYCFEMHNNIRIDTHEDNLPMQRALLKNGFLYCGRIYIADGTPRLAYQKC